VTRGRAGLALIATSLGLVALTSFLGNSVASRGLWPNGPLPPYALDTNPSPWLVVTLLVTATALGTTGLLLALGALARGWTPDPKRLLAGGCVAAFALLLVPPVTSDDLYSYTAYGRMVVLHRDPYTTTPNDLGADPVGQQAGEPWRNSPTVYGPVATAEHALAMKVAGRHVRTGAALLALASAIAFAGTGVLLYRAAPDDAQRRRTAVVWTLNPLVLTHLVAGAHVDALLVLLAVAAVVSLRRHPLLAGVLGGAASCVKLSGALVGGAMACAERHRPRRLAALALGAVAVIVPAYYAAGGWTAFRQVRKASRYVSFGSPWRALSVPLDHVHAPRAIVTTLSVVAVVALIRLLYRALPGEHSTARTTAVVTLAWLIGATYVLPWYDAWLWPFLALLPGSRWDRWLALRTALLTVAYLPGRLLPPLPSPLAGTMSGVRLYVTPVALGLLAVVAVQWCRERA
jgi:hypothetical protein